MLLRRCVLVLSVLALSACHKTVGPKGLNPETYDAVVRAADALDRLNERRDAGSLLYEPRYLDAEKAVGDLGHIPIVTVADIPPNSTAQVCLIAFRTYRSELGRLEIIDRMDDKRNLPEALAALKETGAEIDQRLRELRGFL
jgi:hypothetical protein